MKTLVVGCDASGKSSMLEGIQEQWGDHYVESTRSKEATTFRKANHTRVMRQVISEPHLSSEQIIDAWQEDEARVGAESPDLFVLTYANFSLIRKRMEDRQVNDQFEHYWGFNAPLFLEAYQERWKEMMSDLSSAAFNCISLDTSEKTKDECVAQYSAIRQDLHLESVR